ncbi:unnamed protein product [Cuscuta campestris]|uniref:Uncharacterized protein n=1 Tax=Cuscuta campestris TaxID=132261 RepID=A0A484LKR8_9ASTE|nr:unnamed protein product [Cuscuta campestris]
MEGTVRCSANYVPLTPISFLERSAVVYADNVSIVHGARRFTWRQTRRRCLALASALSLAGISRRDVVAALAPNIPAMYELHFGVPMAGAVLCTLNTRHDSSMVATLLRHSQAKLIFVDHHFFDIAKGALEILLSSSSNSKLPSMVVIRDGVDDHDRRPASTREGCLDYESFLDGGSSDFEIVWPNDEIDPISLNYTSGTTSSPKGVVYSHRGAYLNALATVLLNDMTSMPVYLWVVPMFHCNGWCLTWGVAAQGGTNICLRSVTAKGIFDSVADHRVTHMGGAPTVLNTLVNAPPGVRRRFPEKVVAMTGAAPPPPHVLSEMEALGFEVVHSYGLTETYGPGTICTWKPEWDRLPPDTRAKLKARQGLNHIGMEGVEVKDPLTMETVPSDGKTLGEVMFRGNTVMSGYFKDSKATQESLRGGWFRSGDLGVKHPDGYVELKDRSKDIIISGGENISTIEVEAAVSGHPAVLEAAVVGRPDDHWGETPCAFVKLKDGFDSVTSDDIIRFCRDRLPRYMAPRTVVFGDLPKTSTGKTQKFLLRERTKAMGNLSKGSSKL